MVHVKRLLYLIVIPLFFCFTLPVDLLAFPIYYIAKGRCYCDDYQPFSFAVIGFVTSKEHKFLWNWDKYFYYKDNY